ncbi:hypothetical protein [uncultured Akkermansia sp.]|uniref:hypothetical protein n=1 Tax=uncultured Akkermansia sp. TaxID=512294 RepID=UPI002599391A|nr:hypothetical protein [uncultured Akkermansia sp.]
MENSEFLWQGLMVLSMVGNAFQGWARMKDRGKPKKVDVNNQPVEVIEGKQVATMDNIKVLHHRLDEHGRRLETLEAARETDKKEIVDEIIKMREQSHEQFSTLNRAIGRLEGSHLQG